MEKNLNPKRAKLSPKQRMLKESAELMRRYEKLIDEFEALPPEIQKRLEELKRTSVAHWTEAYGLAARNEESSPKISQAKTLVRFSR
jgi:collagenase-like PrtC family protease